MRGAGGNLKALRTRAKNMTATTTVTAIIMPEPMSPAASRARSPRASSMPSAGTSGNRVRKYSSVIPSLPHAKTLQLFNVIAQLRSSGGGFSVNWGVLGVQGKGTPALEQRATFPYHSDGRAGHRVRLTGHFGGCPNRLAAVRKVGAARKMRLVGAPSRLLFHLLTRGLRPRGLSTSADSPLSRY